MVADQPLFTLAKKLQWKFHDSGYGEDSFLVMLGPMHTEKMLWSVSGDCLDGSGWTTALTNSGNSTSGKAQSFIGVHHICRTRYMHQISVASLYMLMQKAYDHYLTSVVSENPLPLESWKGQLTSLQPLASYWLKSSESTNSCLTHWIGMEAG